MFICIGLIIPKDWLVQFGKIPDLIQHFQHHNEAHEPIAFLDYLVVHFSGNDHHEKDHHPEHDNLPLSHQHSQSCLQSTLLANLPEKISFILVPPSCLSNFTPTKQSFLHSSFYPSIWQPPKTA